GSGRLGPRAPRVPPGRGRARRRRRRAKPLLAPRAVKRVPTIYNPRLYILFGDDRRARPYRLSMRTKSTASLVIAGVAGLLLASPLRAEVKEEKRLEASRDVLQEFIGLPQGPPRALVDKAECGVVIPDAKKLALGIGARFGKGAMSCRTGNGRGRWGAPLMVHIEGGSYGAQIGGQETDLVMFVMNRKGAEKLLE